MKCSIISSKPLGVFSSRFFVFKFIVHALPTLYTYHPSLNKLYKTFIKVMKMSRLRKSVIDLKKMYPKKTYIRSIRSSGVGKCFFLRAQGWGTDHQETKNLANPRSMPRRHGNRSKLNHATSISRLELSSWVLHKGGLQCKVVNKYSLLFPYYVILPYKVKRTSKIRGRNTP